MKNTRPFREDRIISFVNESGEAKPLLALL